MPLYLHLLSRGVLFLRVIRKQQRDSRWHITASCIVHSEMGFKKHSVFTIHDSRFTIHDPRLMVAVDRYMDFAVFVIHSD